MKKIVILICAVLLSSNIVNAHDVKFTENIITKSESLYSNGNAKIKDYNFIYDKKQLGKYLELNESDTTQVINVYKTYDSFCEGMLMAKDVNSDDTRLNIIFSSIDYVLRNMKCYLNKNQYKKFLVLLNGTFYNKGFLEETCLYCDKNSK